MNSINKLLSQYIVDKNDIVDEYLGLVLVPENQLTDTLVTTSDEVKEIVINLNVYIHNITKDKYGAVLAFHNCTYCPVYNNPTRQCDGCPMDTEDNNCKYTDSTYKIAAKATDDLASNDQAEFQALSDALVELAKELVSDIKNVRDS